MAHTFHNDRTQFDSSFGSFPFPIKSMIQFVPYFKLVITSTLLIPIKWNEKISIISFQFRCRSVKFEEKKNFRSEYRNSIDFFQFWMFATQQLWCKMVIGWLISLRLCNIHGISIIFSLREKNRRKKKLLHIYADGLLHCANEHRTSKANVLPVVWNTSIIYTYITYTRNSMCKTE